MKLHKGAWIALIILVAMAAAFVYLRSKRSLETFEENVYSSAMSSPVDTTNAVETVAKMDRLYDFISNTTGSNIKKRQNGIEITADTSSTNAAITINKKNSVGIGTSDPTSLLHVFAESGNHDATMMVENPTSGDAFSILRLKNDAGGHGLIFKNSTSRTADGGPNTMTVRNDAGALRLQGGNGQQGIVVNGGGVGIGTETNPWFKLSVEGNTLIRGNDPALMFFDNRTDYNKGIGHSFVAGFQETNAPARFHITHINPGGAGYEYMSIKKNGNVGISTSNPNHRLDVAGRIATDSGFVAQDASVVRNGVQPGGAQFMSGNLPNTGSVDMIGFNTWWDESGGNKNVLSLGKNKITGRVYQVPFSTDINNQTFNNSQNFRDLVMTDVGSTDTATIPNMRVNQICNTNGKCVNINTLFERLSL
jgi:hypothetical protein